MQRVRRAAAVAVVGLLGGLGLTACQSQPGAAAYVGSTEFSVSQVKGMVDEFVAANPGDNNYGALRQQVVGTLVFDAVAKRLIDSIGAEPAIQPAATPLARALATQSAYLTYLLSSAPKVAPPRPTSKRSTRP